MLTALPTHEELQLPLLTVLDNCGELTPSEATARVADHLSLPDAVLERRRPMPGWSKGGLPVLQHRLRWVRQSLVEKGFIRSPGRGIWSIADRGRKFLIAAKPGVIINVFETNFGVALWAEANTAVTALEDGALNCVFSSPPYPLLRGRGYGTFTEEQCIDLIVSFCRELEARRGRVPFGISATSPARRIHEL